ncbi:RNA-binding protein 34-like [Argiope bruennichi]|uniref:RNA-binding protein 34-like n=1 Tax=Argiope bruennichi TaxID=94029 RepID=UPI002493F035|nr:RNA-binding protein 34-like [Argiope bruennichi]
MPKYKVGDVAALFPKPSAPKSDTGKKIQSMFDDFYKNSKKLNKPSHTQFGQKKKQINSKEKFSESPRETKKKKRKYLDEDDSLSNTQDTVKTQTKQKKPKLDSAHDNLNGKSTEEEENYFPRNKKKSKHFNSVKENSSAFSKMAFDDGEDESFSQFDSEEQKPSDQKKKKKKKQSQTEASENNDHETLKNKSSKKMKKFVNSKNQSEEFDVTDTSAFDEPMEEEHSSEKKSKKKNKKQKKDKIVHKDAVAQDMDPEDIEDQNDDEEPKIKQKSKKMKKPLPSENGQNQDSETEKKLKQKSETLQLNSSKKKGQRKPVESAERLSRTLFVGNLPVRMTRQGLQKLFAPFGSIEACRLRGTVPVKSTIPKKVAAIKSEFHVGQKSCIGYVVFKDAKDAADALSLNGLLVYDHHIVVNPASSSGEKKTYDEKRSIFIGNLPFDVEDEAIWSAFSTCGHVEAVRAIRDPETGAGKGFGYVLFKNIDSKEAALKLEEIEISGRKIRIKEIKSNIKKSAPSNNNKFNALRRKAKKLKGKQDGPNSRKSLKKLMNREKRSYQKKKIVNIFKKFST